MVLKTGTESGKNHRFKSFRERLDAIKIDPLKRQKKKLSRDTDTSHFIACYTTHVELNLSTSFTRFMEKCGKYAVSLPMVLFHKEEIFDGLEECLEDGNEHSVEALLDLLTNFVRDLGEEFEPYFPRTLALLINLTYHFNLEVVEHTFNAMVYIFKYLARLLTSNLVPLYDSVSVLLSRGDEDVQMIENGEEDEEETPEEDSDDEEDDKPKPKKIRPFVRRFASETLAFLIRKCSQDGLDVIVPHVMSTLEGSSRDYVSAVSAMFAASIKHTKGALHSKTDLILQVLFACAACDDNTITEADRVHVTMISETLAVVLEHIEDPVMGQAVFDTFFQYAQGNGNYDTVTYLTTITAIRKGSRVPDWARVFQEAKAFCSTLSDKAIVEFALLVVSLIQNGAQSNVLANHTSLLTTLSSKSREQYFVAFQILAKVQSQRFTDICVKYIPQLISMFSDDLSQIALFVDSLEKIKCLDACKVLKKEIVAFGKKNMSTETVFNLYWRIRMFTKLSNVDMKKEMTEFAIELLPKLSADDVYTGALYGVTLSLIGSLGDDKQLVERALGRLEHFSQIEGYITGLLAICDSSTKLDDSSLVLLTQNLTSANTHVRDVTLSLISKLSRGQNALVNECKVISSIPFDYTTLRSLVQRIEKLGETFSLSGSDTIADSAVPHFLFGLLTVHFTPAHEAAIKALKNVAERFPELVWKLSYNVLQARDLVKVDDDWVPEPRHVLDSPFTDSMSPDYNLNGLFETYNELVSRDSNGALFEDFSESAFPAEEPFYLRNNVLKVLKAVPRVSENHVMELVPYLLWTEGVSRDKQAVESSEYGLADSWTLKDKIVLLDIFALFHNTKNCPRAEEIYQRYLLLLTNKMNSVQKAALQCILSWKNKVVRKYKDNLFNLLEDSQFKDEMLSFLKPSKDRVLHEDDEHVIFPLALRILYGRSRVVSKSGPRYGKRFAVLSTLLALPEKYTRMFVSLAIDQLEIPKDFDILGDDHVIEPNPRDLVTLSGNCETRTAASQIFFLELAMDLGKQIGAKLHSSMDILLNSVLYCMHYSCLIPDNTSARRMSRYGFKVLTQLFLKIKDFEWQPYLTPIYYPCIESKLPTFVAGNTKRPSALLQITFLWGSRAQAFPLFVFEEVALLKQVVALLKVSDLPDSTIKDCILLWSSIFAIEDQVNAGEFDHVVDSTIPLLLPRIPALLDEHRRNFDVVTTIAKLLVITCQKGYARDQKVKSDLIAVVTDLVVNNKVSWSIQVSLLNALTELVPVTTLAKEHVTEMYLNLSTLFQTIKLQSARDALVNAFCAVCTKLGGVDRTAELVSQLNSVGKRLNEPDWDTRMAAYNDITQREFSSFSAMEWTPLISNMLHFIRLDDLPIRQNSTLVLMRFFESIQESQPDKIELIDDIVMPELVVGMREPQFNIRIEFVQVLENLVKLSERHLFEPLNDLVTLLAPNKSADANFFYNVMHVQILRRQKAVQYLNYFVRKGAISSDNIANLLLPLIEHYGKRNNQETQNLAHMTYKCIGSMTRFVTWEQYVKISKRFVGYLRKGCQSLKQASRMLAALGVAFTEDDSREEEDEEEEEENTEEIAEEVEDEAMSDDRENYSDAVYTVPRAPKLISMDTSLFGTTSTPEERSAFLLENVIPPIRKTLRAHSNEQLTDRIPLGIPVVRFIVALPPAQVMTVLPGTLTTLCQVMRAKQQELRDEMRKLLGQIAEILGARYLLFLLRELKSALRRGAHLHILGYTVWYILSTMTLEHADLDPVAALCSEIIMEDVFGVTGTDKDEEDYRSAMKEVKTQRSYDTAAILASNVSLESFSKLIDPVKTILLHKRLTLGVSEKVETVLTHLSRGLKRNAASESQSVLIMCFEVWKLTQTIESKYNEEEEAKSQKIVALDDNESDYIVNLDAKSHVTKLRDGMHIANLNLLVAFTFDTLKSVLSNNPELRTANNLYGFLQPLTQSLSNTHENVQVGALRVLSMICDLDFPDMDSWTQKWGTETLKIIANSSDTKTQLVQNAFRLLTKLFECSESFEVKESALGNILTRILPDLVESQGQNITFNLVNAVLGRQIVISEVYDVMKQIANIMITHQQSETRDHCRELYFTFLTTYPQSRDRLNAEFQFLIHNLDYPFDSGRQSVLEMIHRLLTEVSDALLKQTITSFFVALTLVLYNDDSSTCREMASTIIKILLQKSSQGVEQKFVQDLIYSWIDSDLSSDLLKVALQVVGFYVESEPSDKDKILNKAEKQVIAIIAAQSSLPWDLVYFAMQLWGRMCSHKQVQFTQTKYSTMWDGVVECLLYPHSWVRLSASRAVGLLFDAFKARDSDSGLVFSNRQLQTVAYRLVRQLSTPNASDKLCTQAVKNLTYIVQEWENSSYLYQKSDSEKDEDDATETGSSLATDWLLGRVSGIIRTTVKGKDKLHAKRACVRFLAVLVSLLSESRVMEISEHVIYALFTTMDQHEAAVDSTLRELASETLEMLKAKIGVSEYLGKHAQVSQMVSQKRHERKHEMAMLAMSDPAAYSEQKMKKNKKKRKLEKEKKQAEKRRKL
ncbi:YALIA101S06e05292g1_1 [Yarrowia lipolytica]|nr:YALIA101S06e05292g1_1 [Yarrowia lipolytica]